jgi:hypothetical protein
MAPTWSRQPSQVWFSGVTLSLQRSRRGGLGTPGRERRPAALQRYQHREHRAEEGKTSQNGHGAAKEAEAKNAKPEVDHPAGPTSRKN